MPVGCQSISTTVPHEPHEPCRGYLNRTDTSYSRHEVRLFQTELLQLNIRYFDIGILFEMAMLNLLVCAGASIVAGLLLLLFTGYQRRLKIYELRK